MPMDMSRMTTIPMRNSQHHDPQKSWQDTMGYAPGSAGNASYLYSAPPHLRDEDHAEGAQRRRAGIRPAEERRGIRVTVVVVLGGVSTRGKDRGDSGRAKK